MHGAKVVLSGKLDGRFVEQAIVSGVTPEMNFYQSLSAKLLKKVEWPPPA